MKKILLLIACMLGMTATMYAQTKVVAHRGYWDTEGSYENSIASLNKAGEIGVFGSEFDVHITADDVLVVNHDASIQGIPIQTSTYAALKDLVLPNGEKLPTLEEYLEAGTKIPTMRMVLEIKSNKRVVMEDRSVLAIVNLVRKYGMEDRTDYIAFSMNVCKELVRLAPSAEVYYLNGDVSPADLKALGMAGLDYHYSKFVEHPEWIKEAHDLGLKVNVWTVNDLDMMKAFIEQGVDFITTNKPVECLELVK